MSAAKWLFGIYVACRSDRGGNAWPGDDAERLPRFILHLFKLSGDMTVCIYLLPGEQHRRVPRPPQEEDCGGSGYDRKLIDIN
ncbi:MAG: hypothetical protein HY246_25795 [Proteobacteria bacterium]|nr:hypothetical protein [Pseudomonadota bacterium]